MVVGILTFHRANNYGAVLQTYALQQFITQLGHQVKIIDYTPPKLKNTYKVWNWNWALKKILFPHKFVKYILYSLNSKKKKRIFDTFRKNHLRLSSRCTHKTIPPCDVYVIGSDQLLAVNITGGVDLVYSGDFITHTHSKKIGYAISTNMESLDYINRHVKWNTLVKRFDSFSLRERSLAKYINEVYRINIEVCVDPTLLLEKHHWDKICINKDCYKNHIVVYQVRYITGHENSLLEKSYILSKEWNCNVIDLSSGKYAVEEWLTYIKYARCVLTSSFHATAFSLIFGTPVYAFKLNDGHDDRYVDLLNAVGVHKFIYDIKEKPLEKLVLDTNKLSKNIELLRVSSIDFLKRSLSK